MLEILQFVFQDFAHWFGAVIMLSVIALGVSGLVKINHYGK